MIRLNNVFILRDLKKYICVSVYKEQIKQQDQERSKNPLTTYTFSFPVNNWIGLLQSHKSWSGL